MAIEHDDDKTITSIPLAAGLDIGSYRLIRELGVGGMGRVFLAEDNRLERKVALKFLNADLSSKPEFRQRFLREAKSAARLNHNNIVTIHDVGEALGHAFISMEYVDGRTLRQLIDTRALTYDQKLDVFGQICEGLKTAHDAGIVHRDLKPANIIVTTDRRVKILDFGLAKGILDGDLTHTGTALGTVNYMSPEQAQGASSDHRSDLFSAGILLFELLSGVNPFIRGHMPATIHAIVYEPVGFLSAYEGDLPDDCQTIIDKAVCKRPADRYQSVTELLDDLERLRRAQKITPAATAQPSTPPSERPSLAVLFLQNLGAEEDEYLCHGITEDLIVDLSRLGSVRVLPMYKIVKFKHADLGPDEIARRLNVTMILDGSLRRSGDAVRISAQLVDVAQDEILWSNRWEETASSLPKIKTALAEGIGAALDVDSSVVRKADVGTAETSNPEAYDLYLKGKFAFDRRKKKADVEEARGFFTRALELEPTMIAAKVGLAEILAFERKHEDALEVLRPALEDARGRGLKADEARVRVAMGISFNRIERLEEAAEQLRVAAQMFADLNDISGEARAVSELMKPLANLGRADDVLALVKRLNELSDAGADGRWIAQGKHLHALILFSFKNDATTAKALREEALQLARAHGNHTLTARILGIAAKLCANNAEPEAAIAYLEEARYIAERLGDPTLLHEVAFNTSILEMNLGAFRQFYDKAEEVLRILQEGRDFIAVASHRVNWAEATRNLGKYDEALSMLGSMEGTLWTRLAGSHRISVQCGWLEVTATIYMEKGESAKAIDLITKARSMVAEQTDSYDTNQIFTSGGEIFFAAEDWTTAREWFERGLELSQEADFKAGVVSCTGHLNLMRYRDNADPEALKALRTNCDGVTGHSTEVIARRLLGQALLENSPTPQQREQGRHELLQALGLARKMEWVPQMRRIQAVLDRNE